MGTHTAIHHYTLIATGLRLTAPLVEAQSTKSRKEDITGPQAIDPTRREDPPMKEEALDVERTMAMSLHEDLLRHLTNPMTMKNASTMNEIATHSTGT